MPTPVPQAEWHAKPYGGYPRESQEAFDNAICVYNLLTSLGWTLQAMCAFWGNVEAESTYNPWRWENDYIHSSNDDLSQTGGYGLVQFTPSGKYIYDPNAQSNIGYGPNFSDWTGNVFDGDSQCRFINDYADYEINAGYNYPITYDEFKTGYYSPEYLAKAWLHNYERPGDQSEAVENYRAMLARYWYDILIEYDPSEPIPPEGGGGQPTPSPANQPSYQSQRMSIMFYLKPWYRKL